MKAEDVTETLAMALKASGCDSARVAHRPRLMSDNGPCYIAGDLATWLSGQRMDHTRGAPNHPLENYFLPGDLEVQIYAFVDHYNHRRFHESLGNLKPADVYFGRDQAILLEREGSSATPSTSGACCIARRPHRMTTQMGQSLH